MSKSDKLYYVPFMVKDWVIDTQELTLLERGAYITIITNMYLKEDGILLEKNLHNLLGLKGNNYNRVMATLDSYLIKTDKGYTQKKVQEVLKDINHKRKVNSHNGRIGGLSSARAKQLKNASSNQTTPSVRLANPSPNNKQSSSYTLYNKQDSIKETQEKKRLENVRFNRDMINNNI
jgi:uncharacterized protein YdaU (DUF1376 family)|tara:strand:+ start:176 stop:706 length:531 start_codon:yes stop_codon:yes gene_type:complete